MTFDPDMGIPSPAEVRAANRAAQTPYYRVARALVLERLRTYAGEEEVEIPLPAETPLAAAEDLGAACMKAGWVATIRKAEARDAALVLVLRLPAPFPER